MNKICNACLEDKPLVEFFRDRQKGDGYSYKCKVCTRDKRPAKKIVPETMICTRCGMEKAISEMTPSLETVSGFTTPCLKCKNERQRDKRRSNPEHHNSLHREWREKNRDYDKQRKRDWAESNRDKQREHSRRSRKKNCDTVRLCNQRYRARKAGAEGEFLEEEWTELCNQYDNRCLCCGRSDVILTRDHVVPISKGGTNWIDNIQPLCGSCNSKKKDKEIDYRTRSELHPIPG